MNEFGISKEDWETLTTLNLYGAPELKIPTAAKTAFTRTYSKIGKVISSDELVMKSSKRISTESGEFADDDGVAVENDNNEDDEVEEDDETISKSKMIKMKEISKQKEVVAPKGKKR